LNLRWLRISMSYHRFHNLREMLQQGDLSKKVTEGMGPMDFKVTRACNSAKEAGEWASVSTEAYAEF
jgi:hypothetical protein